MIVVVAAEKGGTGKSTLAVHLAGWSTRTGRDVLLVDADRQVRQVSGRKLVQTSSAKPRPWSGSMAGV